MKKDDVTCIAPDPRQHAEELFDLLGKVFSHNGYFAFRDRCRHDYVLHSHYDWQVSRVAVAGGRIVAHFGVWDYLMRIGSAVVRTGGIGAVATHGDFRGRGLMARTAAESLRAMRDVGYDMTVLFGIPDFYHRFGYVPAWPAETWRVAVDDLPGGAPRMRAFTPAHRADLAALYNRQNTALTGTAMRPTYPRARRERQGRLWLGAGGRPAGYIVTADRRDGLECVDFAGPAETVLAALAAVARRAGHREVVFGGLHRDSDLCRRLRRGNCRVEVAHARGGGAMVRTVNLRTALTKLAGELSRRLRASALAGWRGRLHLTDPRDDVLLVAGPRGVRVADAAPTPHAVRGGEHLARLLIGSADALEVAQAGGIRLTGDARKLLPALFPNCHPMLATHDRF